MFCSTCLKFVLSAGFIFVLAAPSSFASLIAVSGSAADVDWQLDCVPVDFVAKVLVHAGQESTAGLRVLQRKDWNAQGSRCA